MLSDLVSAELPYLRRYARSLIGQQEAGDAAVGDMIESLVFQVSVAPDIKFDRMDLFRELDKTVMERVAKTESGKALLPVLEAMTAQARRVLLLCVVEGFTVKEAGKILQLNPDEVERVLREAEETMASNLAKKVLIIEDEPMVAQQLSMIVESAGHSVSGIAMTKSQALELDEQEKIEIILSDIRLADESSGIDAVADILTDKSHHIPVIFITAYPERLLEGRTGEPAYLINKPFNPSKVKTILDQAALSVSHA